MGLIISGKPLPLDPPIAVVLTLECDEPTEIFCRGIEKFEHDDGYIGAHRAAIDAGWLERSTSRGRVWLCPRCSGKLD